VAQSGAAELRACLSAVDEMIERARLLSREYDRRVRGKDLPEAADPAHLEHAISFPEVRRLDQLCRDTLERFRPDLAHDWYVNEDVGVASPEELHTDLVRKRQVVQHALYIAEADRPSASTPTPSPTPSPPAEEERTKDEKDTKLRSRPFIVAGGILLIGTIATVILLALGVVGVATASLIVGALAVFAGAVPLLRG
jgi:hypothetical protein